jgi:hypothetical protein
LDRTLSPAPFLFWRAAALAAQLRPHIGRSGVSCAQFPSLVPLGEKHLEVFGRSNTLIQSIFAALWGCSVSGSEATRFNQDAKKGGNGPDSLKEQATTPPKPAWCDRAPAAREALLDIYL